MHFRHKKALIMKPMWKIIGTKTAQILITFKRENAIISNFIENPFKEAENLKSFLETDFKRLDSNQNQNYWVFEFYKILSIIIFRKKVSFLFNQIQLISVYKVYKVYKVCKVYINIYTLEINFFSFLNIWWKLS
jgi:hypothetical protein